MSELNPMNGETLDLTKENIQKLKELFPEVLSEDQIDFEKLRLILGDEVNDHPEKYSFTWNGKSKAIRLAQQPSTGTLRPSKEKSKNWDTTENLYIEGDNLEVLKQLQKSYSEKIKVIYIDPPYNTGKDFVYVDNYKDNIKKYFEQTGQVDSEGKKLSTNAETSGRFHTDWLNMMYPRLILAKNLLADDGLIFISINDEELSNIKKICDEVFGENNFIENYIWESTFRPDNSSKITRKNGEYILCYSKHRNNIVQLKGTVEKSDGLPSLTKNSMKESTLHFKKNQVKTFLEDGLYYSGKRDSGYTLHDDIEVKDGKIIDGFSLTGRVIWGQDYLENQINNGTEIIIKSDSFVPYSKKNTKTILAPNKIIPNEKVDDVLKGRSEVSNLFDGNAVFSYPKPVSLIGYLIDILNNKEAVILDFFAGSSTTAHATMELNASDGGKRKFIMVQLPEPINEKEIAFKEGYSNISEISQERIRRAGDKVVSDNQLLDSEIDTGFKVFKLDSSNIQKWNVDSGALEDSLFAMENNFIEGRSHFDIVYEIMLKLGLDLNIPFEEELVDGSSVYDIALGNVFVVLGDNLTHEVANFISEKQKDYKNENPSVIFNDNGFMNDNEKLNSIEILKNNGFNEEQLMSI